MSIHSGHLRSTFIRGNGVTAYNRGQIQPASEIPSPFLQREMPPGFPFQEGTG